MEDVKHTPFLTIYDSFLNRIESSMYMEMTELDTYEQLQDILVNAIPRFKLPRFDIFDYELGYRDYIGEYCGVDSCYYEVPATAWVGGFFNTQLTVDEVNILSLLMVIEWLGQQLVTTELTKMKFTGSDFKMSSQANHMAKLKVLIDKYEEEAKSLQNTYKRRIRKEGKILSTLGKIMETPSYGYKIN